MTFDSGLCSHANVTEQMWAYAAAVMAGLKEAAANATRAAAAAEDDDDDHWADSATSKKSGDVKDVDPSSDRGTNERLSDELKDKISTSEPQVDVEPTTNKRGSVHVEL